MMMRSIAQFAAMFIVCLVAYSALIHATRVGQSNVEPDLEVSVATPYCLHVHTGTESKNQGTLDWSVDIGTGYTSVSSGLSFDKDTEATNCFATDIIGLQVNSPTDNAWSGSIEYSSDGGLSYSSMACSDCGEGTGSNLLVVDGNSDSDNQAKSTCLAGVTCMLVKVTPYCLKVTTGTESKNQGTLDWNVDTGVGYTSVSSGLSFDKGSGTTNCFGADIIGLQVNSPTDNAWSGSIEYSSDGGLSYSSMVCSDCGEGTGSNLLVVDGNSDSGGQAKSTCLAGATCMLVKAI